MITKFSFPGTDKQDDEPGNRMEPVPELSFTSHVLHGTQVNNQPLEAANYLIAETVSAQKHQTTS